jgi:glutathione-regulated potassium-efflux system ancillary protein KefC
LLIVVAIAALMQGVGLSMALGAFLGGVLLAESEYKHELEADIEPFKGLLLGLFFIAVGMSIDFGVLLASPGVVLAIVIGFLIVKAAVIYALARAMGIAYQDRPVFTLLLAQGGEFAFVVFQAAAGAKVFDAQTASLLIGAVAISMLLSPLILLAIDKFLLPRFANCNVKTLEEISEQQEATVIIAGFGRYGQIVARMLMAQGVNISVLDHDADRIDTARAFGYRVFYGDATRADLLRLAGAADAKVLVIAVDNVESANALVDLARGSYPNLQLHVRVRDLTHAFEMLDRGVTHFERELFESSVVTGHKVLNALGFSPDHAHRAMQSFRDHNIDQMLKSHAVRHDRNQLIALAKQSRADLEAQMQADREQIAKHRHSEAQREAERKAHADAVADGFNLPKIG